MANKIYNFYILICLYTAFSCNFFDKKEANPNISSESNHLYKDTLQVTVSAYNTVKHQTHATYPTIAAWGDTLKPGMDIIAVSRDLLSNGLHYNTQVKIEGFDAIFLVKDKMNRKWRNRIDIYMGNDVERAQRFGKKKLHLYILCDSVR